MRRWTKNILCLLSLLIVSASMALWVRSYLVGEDFNRKTWGAGREEFQSIASRRGAVELVVDREQHERIWKAGGWGWSYARYASTEADARGPTLDEGVDVRFAGIHFIHRVRDHTHGWESILRIVLPLWLFLPFSIPPILWWRNRRRAAGRGFAVGPASGEKKEGLTTEGTEKTEKALKENII